MSRELDYAAIEVEGLFLDAWTSYSFQSDLFTPADAFHLSIGIGTSNTRALTNNLARLRALLKPGQTVKLWIGSGDKRALQAVCVIDAREVGNDADSGTTLTVSGRDQAAKLIGSAADPKLYAESDTLVSVARKAVAPWKIEVTADHVAQRDLRQARVSKEKMRRLQDKARSLGIPASSMSEKLAASIDRGTIDFEEFAEAAGVDLNASRARRLGLPFSGGAPGLSSLQIYQLRVKDVRPQSGETVWEYLDRHAKRNGLLMQMDPQGRLVFMGLEYNQTPSYALVRRMTGTTRLRAQNNILSGGDRFDLSDAYKRVLVYGRVKGNDATRSPFKGEAVDTSDGALPYDKTLQLHDSSIKSKDDAQIRAEYELAKSKQGARVLQYTVRGHSANGLVFATDTVAQVEDQVSGVSAPYYITSRTFARSAQLGPTTELRLVPLGSIALREVA